MGRFRFPVGSIWKNGTSILRVEGYTKERHRVVSRYTHRGLVADRDQRELADMFYHGYRLATELDWTLAVMKGSYP